MPLKRKVMIMLGVVFVALLAVNALVLRTLFLPSYQVLENAEAERSMRRVVSAIAAELDHLDGLLVDWSAWDDTWEFAQSRDGDYVASNLVDETFTDSNLSLIYFFGPDGRLIWGSGYDHDTGRRVSLPRLPDTGLAADHPLMAHDGLESRRVGLLGTVLGPLLVAARPVITSSHDGPARGIMIMGRRIDSVGLAAKLEVALDTWRLGVHAPPAEAQEMLAGLAPGAAPRLAVSSDGRTLDAYHVAADLFGEPLLLLRTRLARDIAERGEDTVAYALVLLALTGLVLVGATIWALQRGIVAPLARLTGHVGHVSRTGDLFTRLDEGRGDEIGVLAREFNCMQERIAVLAHFDVLTGLPNRALFRDRAEHAVALAARTRSKVAVMFLDLDRFKMVNDTMGHAAGDRLLVTVAERLQTVLRDTDTLSRHGGDEFTVLLEGITGEDKVAEVAEKLLAALAPPIDLDGQETYVTTSIGASVFPGDAWNVSSLLRNADAAMYEAKAAGRNRYRLFSAGSAMRGEALSQEAALRRGLEQEDLTLQFQPQVRLSKMSGIVGCEALVRWRRGRDDLVPAGEFIRVAEEAGLVEAIDRWVLAAACAQARVWSNAGMAAVPMSVNIATATVESGNLVAMVEEALSAARLSPTSLTLEVSESLVLRRGQASLETLTTLRAMGVRVVVDDFGTGYAALAYLKAFPVDGLKIDRSFIADLHANPGDRKIAAAIVALAHGLGATAIAEGVERREQAEVLGAMGCDIVQGFLFGEPMSTHEFGALLSGRTPYTHLSGADTARSVH